MDLTVLMKYNSHVIRYFTSNYEITMNKQIERRSNRIVEVIRMLALKLIRRADYDPARIYWKAKRDQYRKFSF